MVGRQYHRGATAAGESEHTVATVAESQSISQCVAQILRDEGFPLVRIGLARGLVPARDGRSRIAPRQQGGVGIDAEEVARLIPVRVEAGFAADRGDHIDIEFGERGRNTGVQLPAVHIVLCPFTIEQIDHPIGIAVGGPEDPRFDRSHGGIDHEIEARRIVFGPRRTGRHHRRPEGNKCHRDGADHRPSGPSTPGSVSALLRPSHSHATHILLCPSVVRPDSATPHTDPRRPIRAAADLAEQHNAPFPPRPHRMRTWTIDHSSRSVRAIPSRRRRTRSR